MNDQNIEKEIDSKLKQEFLKLIYFCVKIFKRILIGLLALVIFIILITLAYLLVSLLSPEYFQKIYLNIYKDIAVIIIGLLFAIFVVLKWSVIKKSIKIFLISTGIFYLLLVFFVGGYWFMADNSLKPYLMGGHIFIYKISDKSIQKGDFVVIQKDLFELKVQIVIGSPGDKIELKDGNYFINGKLLKGIIYNLGHCNGIDSTTGSNFVIVPPHHFFGIFTYLETSTTSSDCLINLDSSIYKNSDILGNVIIPRIKLNIEKQ
jgi:signal peptidase I